MDIDSEPLSKDQQSHIPLLSFTSLFFSLTSVFGVTALANADIFAETPLAMPHTEDIAPLIYRPQLAETHTALLTETITENETIPFTSRKIPDGSMNAGASTITQRGSNGTVTRTFSVETYYGEEVARTLVSEERVEPVEEIVVYGTKPVNIDTGNGSFAYTRQLTVWATSYDGNCKGCSGRTATGTPVHHGICAVDPRVIPLGTRFYVPGYGACLAADTGGAIKGNKIDVGFENVKFGWWSSRWVDIYIE